MPPARLGVLPPIGSGRPNAPRPSPSASRPSISSRTVTQMAADRELPLIDADALRIEVVELPRVASRPFGPRFGTLVHTTLATVPLDADEATVRAVAATQGRILLGSGTGVDEEVYAVVEAVTAVLRHPLFDQVRAANAAGRCYRELPLIWQAPDGTLIEGTIDLAFEEPGSTAGGPSPGGAGLQDRPGAGCRGRTLSASAGDLLPRADGAAGGKRARDSDAGVSAGRAGRFSAAWR